MTDIWQKNVSVKHQDIKWNPAVEQWCCEMCGRTSDHGMLEDARVELEQFDCLSSIDLLKVRGTSVDSSR